MDRRRVEQRYQLSHTGVLAQYDCCHCVKLADYRRHTSCWSRRRLLTHATRSTHIIIISILTCRRGASPLLHVEVDTARSFLFSFRRTYVCSAKAFYLPASRTCLYQERFFSDGITCGFLFICVFHISTEQLTMAQKKVGNRILFLFAHTANAFISILLCPTYLPTYLPTSDTEVL
jgi:hypothetical protein